MLVARQFLKDRDCFADRLLTHPLTVYAAPGSLMPSCEVPVVFSDLHVRSVRAQAGVVGGDDDRDHRVVKGLVNVGHVLGVVGELVASGDDAEADLMGGYVAE